MTYSNGVRDDTDRLNGTVRLNGTDRLTGSVQDGTRQLRDIQDLIAKLADVNRQLAQPTRALSMARATDADSGSADAAR